MKRCGTCWAVLKEDENVDEHAVTSKMHAEAVQLLEDRRTVTPPEVVERMRARTNER